MKELLWFVSKRSKRQSHTLAKWFNENVQKLFLRCGRASGFQHVMRMIVAFSLYPFYGRAEGSVPRAWTLITAAQSCL